MPIYSVAAPDGNTYDVEGPEGAKDKDIIAAIFAQHPESGKPPSPAKLKERTYSEAFLTDPRAALVSGAGTAVQFPGQIYGLATGDMDTAPMRMGQELQEIGQGMKSKGLLAREAASAKAIQESEKEGQIPAFGTAIMETIKDPALLSTKIIEQFPQLLVPFGGAKLAKGAVAAKAALTGLPLGEAAIGELATKSAIAAAALQQGADVGSDAYKSIYDILIAKGIEPAQAAETAINQARAAGASGAVISLLVQKIPGARALEETLAGVPGKGGKLGRVVAGTLGGGASESLEESGGQLSKNIAIKDVSPEQSLLQGLGQTAGLAFVPGAGLGLASSMMQRGPAAPQETTPPEAVPPVQGTPPVTPSPASPVSPLPGEAPPMLALPAPPGAEPVAPPTDGVPPVAPPTGEVPPTTPIDFGDYTTGLPKDSEDVFQKMQNRDRTTTASVEQMTGIVGNPDYDRLRVTPDFGSGAPVIISDVKIPTNRMGTIETTTAANGRKIDVQYAVLSAEDIMASNSANGIPNKSYGDINIPGIRAVAGNGRIAGLQGAYEQGNAAEYTRKLLADKQHGIDPEVIKRISNPVLVRVMRQSDITPNIGDISNAPSQLGLNPVEMAKNDQGRIDLAGLQFNEDGSFDKNTLQQFVLAMPQEERGTLLDGEGKANSIARTRLNNAIFYKGYDSESLINLYAQALDTEAANIMRGLSMAASKMARLANAGEYDIRNTVAKATEYAINARRRNISLKDIVAQGDMSMDANTRTVLEMFANNPLSSKKIGESLKRLADAAYEQTKAGVDMFGNVPKVPLDQIFKAVQEENPPPGLFDQEEKKEFEISKSSVQIDKELTGKSITDATQWLIDNAPNSVAKYIAQKIDARIKDMVASGVPMDFIVLKGAKRSKKAHGSSAINPRGVSGKTEFTVKINGYDAQEFGRGISGVNYSTIMHELLHAATQTDTHMLGKLGLKYGTEISKLYAELTPLLLRIRKQVREDIAANVNHPFLKEANIAKRYLPTVDELIAYGLTEHSFQDYLKTIKVNAKQNAFTGLITAIRKMLKIESQYQTALEKLAGSVETSLDRKFSELQSDIGKGIGRTLGIKSTPQTSPSKTRRDAVELEGRLFGGSYGMVLGGPFAPKGSQKYNTIVQGREQYNAARVEAGLPEVSDWRKRPEQLMQRLPLRSETPQTSPSKTQLFKEWFGDSKIVDKNGEPLVVYHGTFSDIDKFNPTIRSKGFNALGSWFTASPSEASLFGGYYEKKNPDSPSGAVYPVHLSIKNPLEFNSAKEFLSWAEDYALPHGHGNRKALKEAERKGRKWLDADPELIRERLRLGGKDGVVIKGGGAADNLGTKGDWYIALNPNQIKSVFNANPTAGPEISFSRTEKTNVTNDDLGREKTGQLYEVYNRKTGKVVGGPYQTRSAARSGADRNDNKYGGYAHDVREIYNPDLDTAEASQETEEPKPRSAESMRKAAQELLQKRKPPPAAMFEGVPEDFIQKARPIFSPERKTILDKIEGMKNGFWQKLAQGTVDSFRTIKEYSQEAYMLARLSKTVDGALHGLLFNGHVFDDGGALNIRPNTKGLIEALKPVGAEVDRYQMYIALNREARLPAHKRSKIAGMQELVDRRDELVNGKINGVPREEVYNKVRQDLNALNKSVLKFALDKGLINSTAKMIADTQARTDIKEDEKLRIITGLQNNPVGYERFANDIYYIPFFREMEDGDLTKVMTASGLTNQHFSKELKGGSAPFGDLMENTLQNWSHILSASMKNQAAAKTIEAAIKLNGAEPNFKPYYYMADGLVHSTSNGKVVGDGELKPWMTTGVGGGKAKVMIDGQPTYFNITDPMLMDSIMSIGYLGPKSAFLDVAKNFKNILQYGVTIAPAFKVRNLFRDSISAMAVSDLKKNPFANIVKGWELSNENNPAHIAALAGGGVFNFGSIMEGDQSRLVKKLLARGVPAENILNTPERVKAALAKTWRLYEELGNKSESANRMALYQQMRDKGMSHMEASFHARDLLDFSMHGAWPAMHVVTQTIPFLNARMQGLYKLGRDGINPTARVFYNTITGKPLEQTDIQKATSFTIVSSAVALASLMLYAAFKDDEDFKKRDGWDRDNFWWFKIPGMKHALYIPKPFEIGAFGTIVERTAEQIFDQGAEGKQFEDSLKRMLTDTFAVNFPQIVKPLVDLYSNKDSFTDSPIESAGMERLSKAERITDNTSPLAIALGGISNAVMPKDLVMSPVQMDYAIKGFFGWLGGTAAWASKFAVAPFREGAYPSERWENTVSMGFIRELPATQSGYVTSFYDNAKQISQAYADMRHYAALGESDKVLKILEDKGDKIQLAKFYDKTSKEMAGLRKQIAFTYADKDMSGPDKKERIDSLKFLISDIAKQAEDARKSLKN